MGVDMKGGMAGKIIVAYQKGLMIQKAMAMTASRKLLQLKTLLRAAQSSTRHR